LGKRETDAAPTTSQERRRRPLYQNRALSRARGLVIVWKIFPAAALTTSQEQRDAPD
jgi:hypothetical protein